MSEFIDNNKKQRQKMLKDIIKKIHDGMELVEAKALFKKHFEEVSTEEITQMEQSLIEEGMAIEEVQRLCDVHASVFEGSISDIHRPKELADIEGHPVNVFMNENDRILSVIETEIKPFESLSSDTDILMIRIGFERLSEITHHYARKENLFFPSLEKKGITSPPKVMWAIDNEIRAEIKYILQTLSKGVFDKEALKNSIKANITKVVDMVTKENNILVPMLIEHITFYNWVLIDQESQEMNYFLEKPKVSWAKGPVKDSENEAVKKVDGEIEFDAGSLTQIELNAILNTAALDMTFVDKDGHVKYFTSGKERIFDRPSTIIGRHVNMCHPPQSVHVVEEIVRRFKAGEKDVEDFWINMGKMFVMIRYFAIRDKEGNYLGTLETTQNIKPLRDLTGEKRLLD
jgi:DUF438 domain-containing protein